MTSIIPPNHPDFWLMRARHLEVDNRRLVEHIERIAEQYRKGDNKKALDQVITWAFPSFYRIQLKRISCDLT